MSSQSNDSSEIKIFQTSIFVKKVKKLTKNQRKDLDQAIKKIRDNPLIGKQKKGDLVSTWVYKFKMVKQEYLLAYQWDENTRTLIALGVHENFYRDLKKYNKS